MKKSFNLFANNLFCSRPYASTDAEGVQRSVRDRQREGLSRDIASDFCSGGTQLVLRITMIILTQVSCGFPQLLLVNARVTPSLIHDGFIPNI
jgi:hypothetical protein